MKSDAVHTSGSACPRALRAGWVAARLCMSSRWGPAQHWDSERLRTRLWCSRCSWTAVSRLNRSQNSAAHDAGSRASTARRRKVPQGAQGGVACTASPQPGAMHACAAMWGPRAAPGRTHHHPGLKQVGVVRRAGLRGRGGERARVLGPLVPVARRAHERLPDHHCVVQVHLRARVAREARRRACAGAHPPCLPLAGWRVRRMRPPQPVQGRPDQGPAAQVVGIPDGMQAYHVRVTDVGAQHGLLHRRLDFGDLVARHHLDGDRHAVPQACARARAAEHPRGGSCGPHACKQAAPGARQAQHTPR